MLELSAYQRGNRDGLLSAAKDCENRIKALEENIEETKTLLESRLHWTKQQLLHSRIRDKQEEIDREREFARRLSTAAEALPIDPETIE